MSEIEQRWYQPYRYEKPPFGSFGVIDRVGDRLVCHMCGRDFEDLATHVRLTHGIDAVEYRKTFGLLFQTCLVSNRIRAMHRAVARRIELASMQPREVRSARLRDPVVRQTALAHFREPRDERHGKVHCPHGHPLDGKNASQRYCLQCNRDKVKRWRLRHPDRYRAGRARTREKKRIVAPMVATDCSPSVG